MAQKRSPLFDRLAADKENLLQFGVSSLSVFGSVARGEDRPGSDVDLLVELVNKIGIFEFIRLKTHLEDLLGRPVDLVTPDALKPQMKERILKEAIRV